ncbi:MAG: glycosyl hydrolase 115 family protein [Lachnospiraceae bacterium]|nr:glycosyl hydrolase 115 family protein [Lachnospiraceae bacterium]
MAELRLDGYINVILDPAAAQGIRRIGAKVAVDVEAVTGAKSQIILPGAHLPQAILVAELGHDALADALIERIPELGALKGRWESYGFCLVEHPLPEIEQGLVIVGSDRISTIYGMFHLSELLGVTAWGFWGDVRPPKLGSVLLTDRELALPEQGLRSDGAAWHPHGEATTDKTAMYLSAAGMSGFAKNSQNGQTQGDGTVILVKNGISKEPSVKYRGFFINDEWPCFGSWTFSHYQGFTAEMYDKIFEYLLRMKGNYLWPAMWSSSFLLDGPGLASMELATEYGIFIGMSHHEPCMRSGEEFSIFKGEHSPYGNDWSYEKNKEGLLKFWEDGLSRVKGQNIFPTIGMRGENDSKMLGDDSTIQENVRQLKEIITEQRKLIAKHINPDLKQVPQLLAIYKEVEDYFFGNSEAAGLRDFEELDDVTLMFCEDNFNNMRALPQDFCRSADGGPASGYAAQAQTSGEMTEGKPERAVSGTHPGGYGMYYHVDYHGSPISYEWVNSTPLTKIWEQMTQAWEYGIRDVWILNVGDVKFNEYPLGYFLSLAYDFETYGYSRTELPLGNLAEGDASCGNMDAQTANSTGNSATDQFYGRKGYENTRSYPAAWVRSLFGAYASEEQLEDITWVLKESTQLHSLRRAEALNDTIYHPAHYGEAKRILVRAEALEQKNEELRGTLEKTPCGDGYYSTIYFPAAGIANLLKMHLYAGLNHLYSAQGKAIANLYGERLEACIARDQALASEMAAFKGGKWSGMEREKHIGFVNWNDEDYRYPVRHVMTLPDRPRLVVSRADRTKTFTNQYFPVPLLIDDFQNAGVDEVVLEIANGGQGTVDWKIEGVNDCFEITPKEGSTELLTEVRIRFLRERFQADAGLDPSGKKTDVLCENKAAACHAMNGSGMVEFRCAVVAGRERVPLLLRAGIKDLSAVPEGAFLIQDGVCVWDASSFTESTSCDRAAFHVLEEYGKYGSAVKAFPTTEIFGREDWSEGAAPSLTWEIWAWEAGEYCLTLHTSPANPLVYGGKLRVGLSVNGQNPETVTITGDGYRGGDPDCADWCQAVLDQEHKANVRVRLREGLNRITVYAGDAGLSLERFTLIKEGAELLPSYLGPDVSYRK